MITYLENNPVTLSNADFERISNFIYEQCGIKMPHSKKIMIEARLRKRLKKLNLQSYDQYCEFLFSSKGTL